MGGIREFWNTLVNGQIDFVAQKTTYDIQFYLIWIAGVIGFLHGYVQSSFKLTFTWVFGATVIATLVCLPSWPLWNRNLVKWLEPQEKEKEEDSKQKENKDAK